MDKNNIIFFTDIDDTLIKSKRKIKEDIKNYEVAGYNKEGKPHSYIKKEVKYLFDTLIENNISIIPTTARNLSSYNRSIFSKNQKIEYFILNFGANIYYKNKEIKEYKETIEKKYNELSISIDNLFSKLLNYIYTININQKIEIKVIENKYILIKYDKKEENENFNIFLKKILNENIIPEDYYLHHNDTSFSIIPKILNKKNAVKYLIKKLKPNLTFGAGDNESDLDFLKNTDFIILPKKNNILKR